MALPVPPEFFAERESLIDSINNECATHITNFLGSSDDVAYFIGSGLSQPDYPAVFQADPEWQKVKAESEANGALVDHIDRYFMDPTSFSALK